jgi:carbon storage regulator CsrA
MLVLTRRCGEQIVIANEIVVTVLGVEGNKVRIGVEAPRSVRIDRSEIHQRRIEEALAGLTDDAGQELAYAETIR